jgi:hypothetical protein
VRLAGILKGQGQAAVWEKGIEQNKKTDSNSVWPQDDFFLELTRAALSPIKRS